jgi:chromosome condensin MukBEF MukE localization factor
MTKFSKLLFVCALTTLLAGCYTANSMYKDLSEQMDAEDAAWQTVNSLAVTKCGADTDPQKLPPKNTAVKQSKCVSALVEQQVIPHAVFPDLIRAYRRKQEFLTGQYADGKLSVNERTYASEQASAAYEQARTDRANQILMVQSQRDNAFMGSVTQAMKQYGADRQQHAMEQQEQSRAIRDSMPIQTHCTRNLAGGVECLSY